ncbi:MAG: Rieske (2Fe-2S) protein [Lautropia sp.]
MSWRTEPHAPAAGTRLCPLVDIPSDNGLEFVFGDGPARFRMVLFRLPDGAPRAYLNVCPHQGIPYNFGADVFCVYDLEERRDLVCVHHAALFHLDDGRCYEGPCTGQSLAPVDIRIVDDWVEIG